jgi:hypothetical protein
VTEKLPPKLLKNSVKPNPDFPESGKTIVGTGDIGSGAPDFAHDFDAAAEPLALLRIMCL